MKFTINSSVKLVGSFDEFAGVFRAAKAVAEDLECVFGTFDAPLILEDYKSAQTINAIIFGTLGKSSILSELEKNELLSFDDIKNKREVYSIHYVTAPFPGIANTIVIAGSDKRGTIYGLYHLSELCSVSPLRKWSGCEPQKQAQIILDIDHILSKEPSVKYRGIFINDEWPAFGNWSLTRFGGVNARCYEEIFEFILRLKGNYIWPAMWASCFSLDGPGIASAELADEMGIVVSSSHHEPCMRAGAEYEKMRGQDSPYGDAWDFISNKEGITRFWEDGLKRNAPFENVITMGMRGENDTAIMGNATLEQNIALLRDVLRTQNELIRKTINPNLEEVPRQIVLFTEVEKFYYGDENTPGLIGDPETDGICIMLSDSNFGYTRTLPSEQMRNHNGGYGMYYHIDMHGGAHAYEWVGTSLLPRMWEQLSTAYDYGVKDIWVVNVGDIATQELAISYFLDLAYNFDTYGTSNPNNTDTYIDSWVEMQFGGELDKTELHETSCVLKLYSQICERRKQEIMNDQVYHPVHFHETDELMEACDYITDICTKIYRKHPISKLTGFYELVYYPCMGTANLMKTWCLASKNSFYATQNRNEANLYADLIKEGIEFDRRLTEEFHQIADGKFCGFGLSEHFGFIHWCEEGNKYPVRIYTEPANKPRMIVSKSDDTAFSIGTQWTQKTLIFYDFLRPDVESITMDIACGSRDEIEYTIACDKPWLKVSKTHGRTALTDKITVSVDRTLLTRRDTATLTISEKSSSQVTVLIHADQRDLSTYSPMTFFEYDGYIAMEAEHFYKKYNASDATFKLLKPYGKTGSAMKVYPTLADFTSEEERPYLEFLFEACTEGTYHLELYYGPSTPVTDEQKMLAGININDSEITIFNTVNNPDRPYFLSPQWTAEAYNNVKTYKCNIPCKAGINSLKYYHISPNLALERIVLYPEGTLLPKSYLGPKESYFIHG